MQILTLDHLDAVIDLERLTFSPVDHYSRAQWRYRLERGYVKGIFRSRYLVATMSVLQGGYIDSLSVHPFYQGQGLATELLSTLKGKHSLDVRTDNHRAYYLYKSFGFKKSHFNEDFYNDGATSIHMLLGDV